jgi:hypothetical protein
MEHLQAYRTLHETGFWPEDFPPAHVELTTNWQVALTSKMADAWVEEHLVALRKAEPREEDTARTSSKLEPGV